MASRHQERAAEALKRFGERHALQGRAALGTTASAADMKATPITSGAAPSDTRVPTQGATRGPRSKARIPEKRPELPADLRACELLSRERLIERWGCGSDSTFHRAERDGLLVPRRDGTRAGYAWPDVFAFEGGQPPDGMEDDYREDLLTEEGVASLCIYKPDTIIQKARRGEIPHRRIGRFYRFVRAEVLLWLESWS